MTTSTLSTSSQIPFGPIYWYLALLAWVALNVWQAAFTGLDADEAYYWRYAQRLDWGYFDHPPLVAVLIKMGSFLGGELGLRLGHVLISGLGWQGLWMLVGKPKSGFALSVLLVLLLSLPMLQIYGFIATPDGPLLCASVWFFLAYRQWLQDRHWQHTLWLGLSMSLLLYAKYHGLLVIVFTFLSYRKLWFSPRFFAAGAVGMVLFLPHLYWQYVQDFPSFRYHLWERADVYQIKYTLQYVLNQLVVAGPLLFPLTIYAVFALQKRDDQLWTALRWMSIGFWIFFLLSTFRGGTEAQWTAVLSVAFVYSSYHYARVQAVFRKWLLRLGWTSVFIFVLLRIWLAIDAIPLPALLANQFIHEEWTRQVARLAGDRPVVFSNSYRDPSLFQFYTGQAAWTFTDSKYRPTQYDLWPDGENLHGKDVLYLGPYDWQCPGGGKIQVGFRKYGWCPMADFQVIQSIRIDWINKIPWRAGQRIPLELNIYNGSQHDIAVQEGPAPLHLALMVYLGRDDWQQIDLKLPESLTYLHPGHNLLNIHAVIPAKYTGTFPISFGFNYKGLDPMIQSPLQSVLILPSLQ